MSDFDLFQKEYENIIKFYTDTYQNRVIYRGVNVCGVLPNSVRFLVQPYMKSKYVYIGDIDIMILDGDIVRHHTDFMKKYNSDFSNILRNEKRLTGLHFIEYEKMYPVKIPDKADLYRTNDEVLLCSLMREKQYRFPPLGLPLVCRKTHGLHCSFFSRPPLNNLTTGDKIVKYPAWTIEPEPEKYFEIRYSAPVVNFTECINERQVELRRVIQIIDMFAYYKLHEHC